MTQPQEPLAADLPSERVGRGVALALVALPLGVLAWLLLWTTGFVASIVALAIAMGALALYRVASGGRVGHVAAFVITLITAVGIAVSLLAGFALYPATAAVDPAELVLVIALSVVFGGLGSFIAWRTATVQSAAERKADQRPLPGFENGPGDSRW